METCLITVLLVLVTFAREKETEKLCDYAKLVLRIAEKGGHLDAFICDFTELLFLNR